MVTLQVDKIIEVINKDANGTWLLSNPKTGRMCVMGGLLHELDVPTEELDGRTALREHEFGLLSENYGLNRWLIGALIAINDDSSTVRDRRRNLKDTLKRVNPND